MSRVLGVDLGSRRIGLAISDPTGTVASPLAVLERADEPAADHRALLDAARRHGADRIVVGLPRALDGRIGPAARGVAEEVERLRSLAEPAGLTVETFDERLTTVIAERHLVAAGVRRAGRRRRVDKVAAAVMLQSYLEANR